MRISDWSSDVCSSDLQPVRTSMMAWLATEAKPIVDGRILLDRLLGELRTRRIVIPDISVVERMAAEAMLRAETELVAAIHDKPAADMRQRLDTLVDEQVHDRQSRSSWLRARIGIESCMERVCR